LFVLKFLRLFEAGVFADLAIGMALVKVRENLPLGESHFAIRARNVHISASVCKEMLLLVRELIKAHLAI
jgi:hypothetical protein